jgi:hypothetical protein
MPRARRRLVTLYPSPEQLATWQAEAKREGRTVEAWVLAAVDLALARGSTR